MYRAPISEEILSSVSSGFRGGNGWLRCFNDGLCRNIPHQLVLRERTAPQPTQDRIEAAAARIIGGENLFHGLIRSAVQVDTDFKITIFVENR